MCDFIVTPIVAAMSGAGAATAAGGAAAAATAGAAAGTGFNLLQTVGLIAGLAGTASQTIATNRSIAEQSAALETQALTERRLNAVEDQRTRAKMDAQIRQQSAELVARNVDLSSPTAVHLGVTAARELSFASQQVRSQGQARQIELSSQQQVLRSRRITSSARGLSTAADMVLTSAPNIWPELLA